MDLREKIKAARSALGITQEELAKSSGISIQNIKKYETQSQVNPTNSTLQKLSRALQTDSDYFVSQVSPNVVSQSQNVVSQFKKNNKILSPNIDKYPQTLNANSYYTIPKLNLTAQAGGGNEVLDLECYESGEVLTIDKAFFKAVPSNKLKAIRVEGYSMIPMLMPDSWVVFEDNRNYKGDGLYIINYAGQLMVKLLQLDPAQKILDIISVNKEYKSYSVALAESQAEVIIVGKVLRCII
ncbi:transcriptional regulator, y4mF family [Helicobacter pullorum]|uniref:XRE family transcriptional regulator n=1 Tax=Helicobacter pullorum TaxID=35818 RepID=UPI000CF1C5CF|nr:LexA family transcriptional regulator [Helicobacter pullorum]VEJ07410.1 transcriptional regulator, y4mF family [Helicobacter pullorum]